MIEESRILSDTFAADGRLQIVFVGQPELHAKLKLPEMRQVDQRVCGYHRLAPLGRASVEGYIQHRLQVAGGRRDRVLFSSAIVDDLHLRSGGVPRLINRVCDRALQLAYERQAAGVDREILQTVLLEIGAATMSPTWDSIIFAEPPSLPPAVPVMPTFLSEMPAAAPAEAPGASAAVAQAIAPAKQPEVQPVPTEWAFEEEDDSFEKQIDHWVEKDLAPASRQPRALPHVFTEEAPVAPTREGRPAARGEGPARPAAIDWSRSLRSETYMQRVWRRWAKRAAIAAGMLIAVLVTLVAIAVVRSTQTAAVLPGRPEAPAMAVAANADVPAEAFPTEAAPTTVVTPTTAAPVLDAPVSATVAAAGDYLVSVGLFSSPARADQLVDELTQAGLPAMQRPFRLRQRDVQQIVLGPFFSRADAVADLQRLQALGGYDDASVIGQ